MLGILFEFKFFHIHPFVSHHRDIRRPMFKKKLLLMLYEKILKILKGYIKIYCVLGYFERLFSIRILFFEF